MSRPTVFSWCWSLVSCMSHKAVWDCSASKEVWPWGVQSIATSYDQHTVAIIMTVLRSETSITAVVWELYSIGLVRAAVGLKPLQLSLSLSVLPLPQINRLTREETHSTTCTSKFIWICELHTHSLPHSCSGVKSDTKGRCEITFWVIFCTDFFSQHYTTECFLYPKQSLARKIIKIRCFFVQKMWCLTALHLEQEPNI